MYLYYPTLWLVFFVGDVKGKNHKTPKLKNISYCIFAAKYAFPDML